jgi:prenyltransferase beta subunit
VVEPTSAVLCAIRDEPSAQDSFQRGITWLLDCQHEDGGWGINESDPESGWQTAWALIAMQQSAQSMERINKAAEWLSSVATYSVTREDFLKALFPERESLDALVWPWLPGQAGWLEPTSLAILALHRITKTPPALPRIETSLDYFSRYRTPTGGWNIGNSSTLDTVVIPRAYHTALTLLALSVAAPQDIQAGDLTALQQDLVRDPGMLAHASGLLAMQVHGKVDNSEVTYLSANQLADGSWEHNPFVTAWAMFGLRGYL